MTSTDKALKLVKSLPKLSIFNIKDLPKSLKPRYHGLQRKKRGFGHKGMSQYQSYPPIGTLRKRTPFYLMIPVEPYNHDHMFRRPMSRISLLEIQRLVDMGRIDGDDVVDITSLCNTSLFKLDPSDERHYGFHLTEEGIDEFQAPLHLEVQHASESVIAAVERAGGTITTRFYDLMSVMAKCDPAQFFSTGFPIPKCKLPPQNAVDYYSNPDNRGYLASLEDIEKSRFMLSQKYGYKHTPIDSHPLKELLLKRKHPRQIFAGLEPGWVVNLQDECVLIPTDPDLTELYGYNKEHTAV